MKNGFKLLLITLPIAAVGAGILAFVISNKAPPERIELIERANAVRVITAEIHTIAPTVIGFGLVTPARTFDAIAAVAGLVEYVSPELRNGQILPAGTVLLRLSPVEFKLAISQSNANIRAAEARLGEIKVSEANQRRALEIEREALAVKTADLTRTSALLAAGTLTQSSHDAARAAHLAQRQKVQGIESTLTLFPTQRAVQIEQIAVYQTNLATAQLNLERSELTLPFTGRVATHTVEVGQYLRAGETAATLDGIDQAEIEVQLSLEALRGVMQSATSQSSGQPIDPTRMGDVLHGLDLTAQVRLRLGTDSVSWTGTIDRISDGVDQRAGTIGVVVVVQAAYGQIGNSNRPPLTKGMFVDVALKAPPITGVVLPRSALHGEQIHIVDAENRLQFVTAQPALVQGEIALFTSSIPEGSRVVLSTPDPVIEGLLLDPHEDTNLMPRLLAEGAQ
ncbi:MAG: hypothetical protein KUG69_10500 [Marinosulfonomonas sp.]|nr:hypothetical protein [Marinosulfonomonas sp.]